VEQLQLAVAAAAEEREALLAQCGTLRQEAEEAERFRSEKAAAVAAQVAAEAARQLMAQQVVDKVRPPGASQGGTGGGGPSPAGRPPSTAAAPPRPASPPQQLEVTELQEQLEAVQDHLTRTREEAAASGAAATHLTGQLAAARAQGLLDVSPPVLYPP
jgi:hypothetical protein